MKFLDKGIAYFKYHLIKNKKVYNLTSATNDDFFEKYHINIKNFVKTKLKINF